MFNRSIRLRAFPRIDRSGPGKAHPRPAHYAETEKTHRPERPSSIPGHSDQLRSRRNRNETRREIRYGRSSAPCLATRFENLPSDRPPASYALDEEPRVTRETPPHHSSFRPMTRR